VEEQIISPNLSELSSGVLSWGKLSYQKSMKWLLLCVAIWNVACALLRSLRMPLEGLPLTRRLYPRRDMKPLDECGDRDLNRDDSARYRAAVEQLCRLTGMPAPTLMFSPNSAMTGGTRGWRRHELHVSRGLLAAGSDQDLLAILAHEFGHIYYCHFATLRIAELFAAAAYACVVHSIWNLNASWYIYLAIWSLLDFSYSIFRLAAGSATELMADYFAARKLGMASELWRGLARARCVNGANSFNQVLHFYPTVDLRLRLLARYAGSSWSNLPSSSAPNGAR
jgi:Zn-dependent protease with chaperone function